MPRRYRARSGIRASGHAAEEAVERADREQPRARFAVAALAHGVDHVVALLPAGDELRNQFRRILEVGVDQHDGIAPGRVEPGRERDLMAEVPREPQEAQALVAGRKAPQHVPRAVGRPVVHEQDLVVAEIREGRGQPAPELLDGVTLVVDRGDDGKHDL